MSRASVCGFIVFPFGWMMNNNDSQNVWDNDNEFYCFKTKYDDKSLKFVGLH